MARALTKHPLYGTESTKEVERFRRFADALAQNEALVRSWADADFTEYVVAGKLARQRMNAIGTNCRTMMIWL